MGIYGPGAYIPCRWAIFSREVSCFFHLVRRFWNHVLICTSVKFRFFESSSLLLTLKYLSCLNSFSNRSNCLALYAWRGFRSTPGFRDRLPMCSEVAEGVTFDAVKIKFILFSFSCLLNKLTC